MPVPTDLLSGEMLVAIRSRCPACAIHSTMDRLIPVILIISSSKQVQNALALNTTSSLLPNGLISFVGRVAGPLVRDYLAKITKCSTQECSGHGRCTTVSPADATNRFAYKELDAVSCRCFDGFSGATCNSRDY